MNLANTTTFLDYSTRLVVKRNLKQTPEPNVLRAWTLYVRGFYLTLHEFITSKTLIFLLRMYDSVFIEFIFYNY